MSKKLSVYALVGALLLAVFGPSMLARAAINYPSVFGQLTGDCTTSGSGSYATTCTKSNGASFAGMAFQAPGAVAVTGGSINGTAIGATTPAAVNGTTDSFAGLSTQTGGHVTGTGDFTASQTLTAANEDTEFTCTAACTATLPATPANGTPISIQDMSTTAGFVTIAANGSGVKVMTPSGPATSYTYSNLYQGAKWVYHTTGTIWIAE